MPIEYFLSFSATTLGNSLESQLHETREMATAQSAASSSKVSTEAGGTASAPQLTAGWGHLGTLETCAVCSRGAERILEHRTCSRTFSQLSNFKSQIRVLTRQAARDSVTA